MAAIVSRDARPECRNAGHHPVHDGAEREQIRPGVDRLGLELFRGHGLEGPDQFPWAVSVLVPVGPSIPSKAAFGADLRDPEVEQLRAVAGSA